MALHVNSILAAFSCLEFKALDSFVILYLLVTFFTEDYQQLLDSLVNNHTC